MYQKERLNMRAFGLAVMEAREGKGWSREQLAEMLDLSARHIMYVETRGQHPSVQRLYELAALFNISIDQYFFPDTAKGKTTQRRQLDAMLDTMGEKDLSVVTATVKAMNKTKAIED